MIAFAWPWIWLLLPLPLLPSFFALRSHKRAAEPIRVPPRLAKALDTLTGESRPQSQSGPWLLWLAWLALMAALSQPSWITGSEIRSASGRAIMLAIDLSGSMERKDFTLDGKAVDRLTAVKSVAADFAVRRSGDRLGLVLFGDEAFVANPLTFDTASVANSIQEAGIGMAGRTTAIGDALGLAIKKLKDDIAKAKVIVLLSDGTNNAGSSEPEDAARLAAEFGIRIHTIGMGSVAKRETADPIDPSADLDEDALKAIAAAADGRFFRVTTTDELRGVYTDIDALERSDAAAPPIAEKLDLRNVFTLLLLATMLTQALLDWRRRPV